MRDRESGICEAKSGGHPDWLKSAHEIPADLLNALRTDTEESLHFERVTIEPRGHLVHESEVIEDGCRRQLFPVSTFLQPLQKALDSFATIMSVHIS
jgi:hypothetical protein